VLYVLHDTKGDTRPRLGQMGNRIPGVVGIDPLVDTKDAGGPGESPGSGWTDPGPLGMDAGSGSSTSATVQMSGWPKSISWADFTELGARPPGENEDAQIHSEVDQPSQVSVTREGGVFRVSSLTVEIRVVAEDNWVVTSQKSNDLLSHEQGHYDLTGLLGRDMGNEIVAARGRSTDDLQAKVTRIIQTYRQRAKAWTERYDTETDHSRNRAAQKRWDDQMHSAMQSGARFSPP
jgi:hypothetical protein